MKKISILIPVYNTSKYLERCLNSIINQNLKEIEIICINDGSTDNSLEILNSFVQKDSRIKIINKNNGGLTTARNVGIKNATGEYCLNIDSDDWIEQGYLEEIYKKAKKENLDMVISDIIFDYEYKKEEIIKKDLNIEENKILTGKEYLKIFLSKNFYGYTWNKLIKKEIYEKFGIEYDEEIFLYEDVEVIAKLALYMKRIGKINKAYYHYIQGENNGSRVIKFKNYLDMERCFNEIKKYYLKSNIEKEVMNFLEFREEYSLFKNLLFSSYKKNNDYYERVNKVLFKIEIMKKYNDLLEEKSVILFFKLEKKVRTLKNKVIIFEIIKKLIWVKQKLKRSK